MDIPLVLYFLEDEYPKGDIMIKEKLALTKQILEEYPNTRGDGNGEFLNIVLEKVYEGKVDFMIFNTESWTRARRKVLAENPHLDYRTKFTNHLESTVRSEMVA